ncbi:Acyl-CoA dehydrogenase [Solimonas aquatica]|uniref:Acyl-CoA dehydrogenase n=1 Tax=Solimonas aquatica TaxID=489703 RepID=A0A1H9LJV3_9GAMM|nr:acyl-CoA dehydrogenase family protein [Solimonas aquatica]SER11193.1 Acyl-CoA dehydrogenase [Solimonas aquatica]
MDGDGQVGKGRFDERAFRAEVREFCANGIPDELAEKIRRHAYFSKEDRVQWQRLLHARGWFVGDWPVAYGGGGWGPVQRLVLIEELERAGTPWLTHFGFSFVGPVIYTFGSEAQKARYLPGIRESKTWWCQGFSEPGAGSDLASVATFAERDGDHYIVSGQKTWTTMAQWADKMFCLVRTQRCERRQQGISFLLIDLRSPGVTVRPIQTIDGIRHVNEVFLDAVRVPVQDRVGEEGDGWKLARFIVGRERLLVAELGKARRLLDRLTALGLELKDGDLPLGETPAFRLRLAQLEVQLHSLRTSAYAIAQDMERAGGAESDASLLKIRGSEMQQAILDAVISALGATGLAFQPEAILAEFAGEVHGLEEAPALIFDHLYSRATSIYGGSNEIQRGIVAKAQLGL